MNSATMLIFAALLNVVFSHSIMSYPEPMTASSCRMGGDPKFGVDNCQGPCDIRNYIEENGQPWERPWTAVYPPSNPVKTPFQRGQKITVKYTRNNHAPGGFNRFTLIRYKKESGPETGKDYMDKALHARNAFHYSCWGARPVVAQGDELNKEGEFGLSMIGTDSQQHDQPAGYYITDITIPTVVPDGLYILGWVWFGGTGGQITTNDPQVPKDHGYFSDYWGCSFIKIEGGVPLAQSYTPVFDNDYAFSQNAERAEGMENGCMAANDKPGVCVSEPCEGVKGFYRKPAAFKDGAPTPLTPANFGGEATDGSVRQELAEGEEEKENDPPSSPSPNAEEETRVNEEEENKLPSSPYPKAEEEAAMSEEEGVMKPSASSSPKVEEEAEQFVPPPHKGEEEVAKPSPSKSAMKNGATGEEKGEEKEVSFTDKVKATRTCKCMYYGSRCSSSYAENTYGCKGKTLRSEQPYECKKVCCDRCTSSHFFCEYMRKNHCSSD